MLKPVENPEVWLPNVFRSDVDQGDVGVLLGVPG